MLALELVLDFQAGLGRLPMTPASLVGSAASNPYPIRCLLGVPRTRTSSRTIEQSKGSAPSIYYLLTFFAASLRHLLLSAKGD